MREYGFSVVDVSNDCDVPKDVPGLRVEDFEDFGLSKRMMKYVFEGLRLNGFGEGSSGEMSGGLGKLGKEAQHSH